MTTPLGQVTGELQDAREYATYGNYNTLPTISSTLAYTGAYSIRASGGLSGSKCAGTQFAAQDSLRCGYWCRHNGIYNGNNALVAFFVLKTASAEIDVVWKRGGDGLAIAVNGVVVALTTASSAGALTTPGTWNHLGLAYIGGVNGSVSFFVNGLPVLAYAGNLPTGIIAAYGIGTAGNFGTNFSTTSLTLGGTVSGGQYTIENYAYMDDFYVDGDIVTTSETPPPDRFLFSLASAAGASAQWTPTGAATNSACVDEAVPNDDTDYVLAAAADLVDKYATANITVPTNYAIVAAIPITLAKVMAAGPTLELVASDGVNADLVSGAKTPGTSYAYLWESMPLAPDGAAWDETKFNAAEFGIKSAGTF